jgi:hypothetical protein
VNTEEGYGAIAQGWIELEWLAAATGISNYTIAKGKYILPTP